MVANHHSIRNDVRKKPANCDYSMASKPPDCRAPRRLSVRRFGSRSYMLVAHAGAVIGLIAEHVLEGQNSLFQAVPLASRLYRLEADLAESVALQGIFREGLSCTVSSGCAETKYFGKAQNGAAVQASCGKQGASVLLYLAAIPAGFYWPAASLALIAVVAVMAGATETHGVRVNRSRLLSSSFKAGATVGATLSTVKSHAIDN